VLTVAIGADGDVVESFNITFPMDTFKVISFDPHMACAAGLNDVLPGNERFRVVDMTHIMGSMAVAAVRRGGQACFFQSFIMDAHLISFDEFFASFSLDLFQVACFASAREVERKNPGIVILLTFYVMRSVAVFAAYSTAVFFWIGLAVNAFLEFFISLIMACSTCNRF
jgi:hypothetical protein